MTYSFYKFYDENKYFFILVGVTQFSGLLLDVDLGKYGLDEVHAFDYYDLLLDRWTEDTERKTSDQFHVDEFNSFVGKFLAEDVVMYKLVELRTPPQFWSDRHPPNSSKTKKVSRCNATRNICRK